MTQNKHLKRRIRERMKKTGERYTAARANVVQAPKPPVVEGWKPLMSDERVATATGRTHAEWFALLDAWRAWESSHTKIATWLRKQGVSGWWSQNVTVAYERARGLRAPNQRADGFYVAVSKTFALPVGKLFDRLHPRLAAEAAAVRTTKRPKGARYDWAQGRVVVAFDAMGKAKSRVTVEHARLPDRKAVEAMRAFWREWLAR